MFKKVKLPFNGGSPRLICSEAYLKHIRQGFVPALITRVPLNKAADIEIWCLTKTLKLVQFESIFYIYTLTKKIDWDELPTLAKSRLPPAGAKGLVQTRIKSGYLSKNN